MTYTEVARLDDLPVGSSAKVTVGGEPVALVRLDEATVKAVHNTCSHQEYDLAPEGFVEDNTLECALHGSVFDLDSGQPDALPAVKPIPVYDCKVEDGTVYIDIDHKLNDAPTPRH